MKNAVIFLLILTILPLVFAWDDCTSGEINCEFPGDCGSYVDTNQDYICDHSQPAPTGDTILTTSIEEDLHDLITGQDLKTKTVREVAGNFGVSKTVISIHIKEIRMVKNLDK